MEVVATRISGPTLMAPAVHGDQRGFFVETYRESELTALGIRERWVQDNHSRSRHGIVRGLHFQVGDGQARVPRWP